MEGRFYRRRWDESRGDVFDGWGHWVWYLEVDGDGRPIRRVEVYDGGRFLRYRPEHEESQYGHLSHGSRDGSGEDWTPFVISRDAFERAGI